MDNPTPFQYQSRSYWKSVWKQYSRHTLGLAALAVIFIFCLVGIYAPFLASSKPLVVYFENTFFFPLFRYLFYRGFFTKRLDLFYNLLIFVVPAAIAAIWFLRNSPLLRKIALSLIMAAQIILFLYVSYRKPQDPSANTSYLQSRSQQNSYLRSMRKDPLFPRIVLPNWQEDLKQMTPYARLNLVLRYQQRKQQYDKLSKYEKIYKEEAQQKGKAGATLPILWQIDEQGEKEKIAREQKILEQYAETYQKDKEVIEYLQERCASLNLPPWITCEFLSYLPEESKKELIRVRERFDAYRLSEATLRYIEQRRQWLETESASLRFEIMPLIRPFHWEEDAGGSQALNQYVSWWDLTRVNRKDMVAGLIFGVRISLSVGLLAVFLSLCIGIPLGAIAGYYGGKTDIILYRLIEVWESMPTFFMLLMVVSFLQSKSIFLVIGVIGLFGWTNFSRFVRGEFFRQKQLPYVEACRALGFNDRRIMFSHLLPNSIPPLLTLVPFAIMGAITSEAGLSFLGLGEEGSCSWGVLMDEGRSAFPAESYLLWPPAILLTILLIAIALVGDSLRDALDPKLHN